MKFTAIHTINLPDRLVMPGEVFEYDEAAAVNLVRIGACSIVKSDTPITALAVQLVEKVEDGDDSLGLDEVTPVIVEAMSPVAKGKKAR